MKKEDKYIYGIKKETYDLLFKDKNLPVPIKDSKTNDNILDEIACFTVLRENNIYDKIKKKIYEIFFHMDFSKISYDEQNKKYNYNCGDKVIVFRKFSDNVVEGDKLKKELLSSKRVGKCHIKSYELIGVFEDPATILTGICEKHGKSYLHSVIEIQKGKKYIADYTLNLIMPKETYIELTQFKELENIKDIEAVEDLEDGTMQFMRDMNFRIKPYVIFRKELKRDLEKNKSMLQETNSEKLNQKIEEIKKIREDFERE